MTADELTHALTIETPEQEAASLEPEALCTAALWYAAQGTPVFPLKTGEKTPATRNGLNDATLDPDQITEWWATNPWFNIGLATGHTFDVIDLDAPHGFDSFDRMCTRTGNRPRLLGAAWTANTGRHLLVTPTGRSNFASPPGYPGLDYRGLGGYIVAPPSRLAPDGRRYVWIIPPRLTGTP